MHQFVNPMLVTLTLKKDRDIALSGLHYRIHGLVKTLLVLTSAQHFQSISSAFRSAIELYVDMELLHRDSIPDGVDRFHAFTLTQRLSAARKSIAFYDAHKQFNGGGALTEMRKFVADEGTTIDAATIKWWGTVKNGAAPRIPSHWADRDLKARAALLDPDFEKLVVDGYDRRNWLVHSGLSGVAGLDVESLTALGGLALPGVHEAALGSIRILGAEFKLDAIINDFIGRQILLKHLAGHVVADLQLRALGEPQRVTLHSD